MTARIPGFRPGLSRIAALLMLLGAGGLAAQQQPTRPNILFIAIDDLNDWIGPLGGRDGISTPNLDRLASQGMTFANAQTASPQCHPSRVAIMTGVRPTTSGILANVFNQTTSWRAGIMADVVTLSQHFRNNGYLAMGGGKIYHALQWDNSAENDPATWDYYFPDPLRVIPPQIRPELVDDNTLGLTPGRPLGARKLFNAQPILADDSAMSDYHVVDWAISELKKPHDKPLFLAVGIFRPHIPWEVPKPYFDLYPLDQIILPKVQENDLDDAFQHARRPWHRWVVENHLWPQMVQGYQASISFADAQLGRLLDGLAASGQADNTIVVLWSDHGMHLGEKENWEKFTLWEEATRVPLFFVVPGVTRPGSVSTRAVSLLDVYPTLSELAGLTPPVTLEGTSLVSLLEDPNAERTAPAVSSMDGEVMGRYVPAEVHGHALRTDYWRYIRYDNGFEELYDHRTDPDEFTNLAKDPRYAGKLRELSGVLDQVLASSRERRAALEEAAAKAGASPASGGRQ